MTAPKWRRGRAPRIVLPAPSDEYERENEAQTRRQIEMFLSRFGEARAGDAGVGGGATGLRQTTRVATIPDVAADTSYESTVDLGGTALLYDIYSNFAEGTRFRLYERPEHRTADASRPVGEVPTYPCLLDVTFGPGNPVPPSEYPDQPIAELDAGRTVRLRGVSGAGEPLLVANRASIAGPQLSGDFYWRIDTDISADFSGIPYAELGPYSFVDDGISPSNFTPFEPGGNLGTQPDLGGGGVAFIARGGTVSSTIYRVADCSVSSSGGVAGATISAVRNPADGMSDVVSILVGSTDLTGTGALVFQVRRQNSSNLQARILYSPRVGAQILLVSSAAIPVDKPGAAPVVTFYADETESRISIPSEADAVGDPIPSEFFTPFAGTRITGIGSQRSSISSGVGMKAGGWYVGPPPSTPQLEVDLTYLPLENFNKV
jgi:hypothetical protein